MNAKVAVVSFSTIESDSRVLRQIESLNSLYDSNLACKVIVFGFQGKLGKNRVVDQLYKFLSG